MCISMRKSPIRSLLQADLGTIMPERTSLLFGIDQILVSATGGKGHHHRKSGENQAFEKTDM